MRFAERLEALIPDLTATLWRFPLPALLAVALCAYWNLAAVGNLGDEAGHVLAGGAAAFLAAGAAHLFAEGRGLSRSIELVSACIAAVLLAAVAAFNARFETSLLFLFGGLVPVLMIAAYLRPGVSQGAIWLFNLRFGLAGLLAIVVALVFAIGLSSIVEALNFLFDAGLSSNLHEYVWGTAATLIGPLYGLSLMPRDLDEEVAVATGRNVLLERGVSVLVNYVLVPIIAVYALILHAYAVKIVLDGALPKGQVATIVSIFALGGTGAWLVAWPWRETGTRVLRLFMRGWFFLTIVPAVLLGIAIWRRISDYGVTPDRYGIVLVAIWVAFITIYLALRRNRSDMRAMLGGIAILLLVGSAGPFGANGLTISSQIGRLVELLEANGLFKDGKVQPVAGKLLAAEVGTEGQSILNMIGSAGGLQRLAPWFEGSKDNPFDATGDRWTMSGKIADLLGFTQKQTPPDYVSFVANAALSLDIAGEHRLVGPLQAFQSHSAEAQQPPMTAYFDAATLVIRLDTATYRVAQKEFLETIRSRLAATPGTQAALSFEIAPGVTIAVDSVHGNLAATPPLGSMRFWLILRQSP